MPGASSIQQFENVIVPFRESLLADRSIRQPWSPADVRQRYATWLRGRRGIVGTQPSFQQVLAELRTMGLILPTNVVNPVINSVPNPRANPSLNPAAAKKKKKKSTKAPVGSAAASNPQSSKPKPKAQKAPKPKSNVVSGGRRRIEDHFPGGVKVQFEPTAEGSDVTGWNMFVTTSATVTATVSAVDLDSSSTDKFEFVTESEFEIVFPRVVAPGTTEEMGTVVVNNHEEVDVDYVRVSVSLKANSQKIATRSYVLEYAVVPEVVRYLLPKQQGGTANARQFMHTLRVGARPSSSSRSQKVNTIPEVVKMDANLLKLSARMRWEDAERNAIRAALTQPNYSELFTKLATLALAGSSQRLRAYDVPGVKLTCVAAGDTKKFSFSVSPHLINNRRFRLHNGMVAGLTSALDERFAHGTFVSAIDKERAIVTVNASDAFYQSWGKSPETLYDVHWLDSTVTVNRMAFAITQSKPLFPSLLFPSERTLQQLSEGSHPQQVESCIPNLNREQKDAAAFITAPSSHLLPPYLMFGPPGTGKTTVLVECILRLLRTSVSAGHRILVCAPANKACDLVAGRLKNEILRLKLGNPQDRVLRLVAESRPLTEVDQSIHDLCFCTDDGFVIPEKKDLQQKEVVICTCSTSAAIYTSGDSAAFSHIFIDEAGQATEPESVLPIVAIQRSSNARIALFGDPFQLGPVIQYPTGLSIYQGTALHLSLLERLSHLPGYQSEQLATAVKAQLIRSYRAHPKLMQVSNERFYENKLQACAPVDERFMEKLARLPGLRNKKCPIIFETVQGLESKQSPDPSRFNVVEAERVLHHVKTVHNACEVPYSEIGVISPYSAQVDRIRDLLDKHGCNDVRVGSVEEYQGDEKTVIIISTVRTSAKSKLEQVETDAWENALGFLRNPKRFNVAMTRAKKLLVVVGDPRVLVMEEDWYAFLVFCRHENAIIGKDSIWEESKQIRDRWLKRHQVSN